MWNKYHLKDTFASSLSFLRLICFLSRWDNGGVEIGNGYNKDMGARPMERFIDKNIKKPLVDKILFGKLNKGGVIKISLKDGEIIFTEISNKDSVKV